ncbi:MAG: class I SAM-dependent methyltransferase [Bacteroidetes bacterium]|nr:class I SAM-dependent methyltransferase [Bacteroidota bacterium]
MGNNLFSHGNVAGSSFSQLYIQLRKKEQRIYTDEQVSRLPVIEDNHSHYNEWKYRRQSSERLVDYLANKTRALNVLEVGCGNGWLSAKIAEVPDATVIGIDVNIEELNQAKRVFEKENLQFSVAEISDLSNNEFDIIIFAASIQYFASFKKVIDIAMAMLSEDGEIHIIDTPLYKSSEITEAAKRSRLYYSGMGFREMSNYYFQHSIEELQGYNYKMLFDPHTLSNRFLRKRGLFYWVCIRKQ